MNQENDLINSDSEEELIAQVEPTKKRRSFNLSTKNEIIKLAERTNNSEAARQYGIVPSMVSRWRSSGWRMENEAGKRKRKFGGGRKPLSEELDERVNNWGYEQRKLKVPVTRKSVMIQARMIAAELELEGFEASSGWLRRFMTRKNLSLRRKTTNCQKPLLLLIPKVIDFILYIRHLREIYNYPLNSIFAADEVGVWMDGLEHTTIEDTGAKEVPVRTTGQEHLRITVLLTARADGVKLPPLVLIPRIRPIAALQKFQNKLRIVYSGRASWIDQGKTINYLKNAVGREIFGGRRLMVWDSFRPHMSEETKAVARDLRMDLAIVPG